MEEKKKIFLPFLYVTSHIIFKAYISYKFNFQNAITSLAATRQNKVSLMTCLHELPVNQGRFVSQQNRVVYPI